MDIEFRKNFDAPARKLWDLLLDPRKMAACIPGTEAVEVINEREYAAVIKVKIAFISARFKLHTTVTDITPPAYLRCETTGDDKSVGSAVKAVSEMRLTEMEDGSTELHVLTHAAVMGRLGSLGLNPMRTKAERMWEAFCEHLEDLLKDDGDRGAPGGGDPEPKASTPAPETPEADENREISSPEQPLTRGSSFLSRLWGRRRNGAEIRLEIRSGDMNMVLHWPAEQGAQCLAWLERQLAGTTDKTIKSL